MAGAERLRDSAGTWIALTLPSIAAYTWFLTNDGGTVGCSG